MGSAVVNIEKTILRNLLRNEDYVRKVIPFLKDDYFTVQEDRAVFSEIRDFLNKYNKAPTYDALMIEVESQRGLKDDQVKNIHETINDFRKDDSETNIDWLIDSTEKFCQNKAIYHAMTSSLEIMQGEKNSLDLGAIPKLLPLSTFPTHYKLCLCLIS